MPKKIAVSALLIAWACISSSVSAHATVWIPVACNPAPYGLKECPEDIEAFLMHVAGCNLVSGGAVDPSRTFFSSRANAKCEWDSCEYEILKKKYAQDEKMMDLLWKELVGVMGTEDFSFDGTCEELIQEKLQK